LLIRQASRQLEVPEAQAEPLLEQSAQLAALQMQPALPRQEAQPDVPAEVLQALSQPVVARRQAGEPEQQPDAAAEAQGASLLPSAA